MLNIITLQSEGAYFINYMYANHLSRVGLTKDYLVKCEYTLVTNYKQRDYAYGSRDCSSYAKHN